MSPTDLHTGLVVLFVFACGPLSEPQAQVPQEVITTNAESAVSVYAADLDGDGAPDALSASLADDKIAWYENQVGENGADADGFGGGRVITTNVELAKDVHAADLNGDGDVLTAASAGDKVIWYENKIGEGGESFGPEQVITTSAETAYSVFAADLDGDGDPDILWASSFDDKVAWYENTSGTLPVELTSLKGRPMSSGTVRLIWETATESQNAGFEVQRESERGFETIGFVEGGGTTTEPIRYTYTAKGLGPGTHVFRLKQLDFDGSLRLTDPVSVEIQMQEAATLATPAQNPVSNSAALSFAVKEKAETTVALYNTLGQRVATLYEGTPSAGEKQTVHSDARGLPSGTYFLRLRTGRQTRTQRLTVVR